MQYGTLLDYISWRGDLDFTKSPFNVVDNLVFSFVAYSNFIDIEVTREENEKGITIKEYYDRLMKNGGFPPTLSWIIKEKELKIIAESKRFGNVLIRNYVDIVDSNEVDDVQFAAMEFFFNKREHYFAFRGTDDSIAGWKEDASLTYRRVPAQELAVSYLEKHLVDGEFNYVGGHSKGGNLAIYGAGKLSQYKLDQVTKIFDNDGPGICKEVMDDSFLKKIDEKTIRIIPTYSVIGSFFPYPFKDTRIVHSNEKGLMQHDIKSWLVNMTDLYCASELDEEARMINETLDMYISDTNLEDRKEVLDDLFNSFDDKGKKKTVTSVTSGGLRELNRVLIQLAEKNEKTHAHLSRLPFTVWFSKTLMKFRHTRPIEFLIKYPSFLACILSLFLGLVFLLVPYQNISYFIASSFVLMTIIEFLTFVYLLNFGKVSLKGLAPRVWLVTILTALSIAFFVSSDVMAGFATIVFGILMLTGAFVSIYRIVETYKKEKYFSFVLGLLECVSMFILGLYFIIVTSIEDDIVAKTFGIFFVCLCSLRFIDGIYEMIKDNKKSNN